MTSITNLVHDEAQVQAVEDKCFIEYHEVHQAEILDFVAHNHNVWVEKMGWHNKDLREHIVVAFMETSEAMSEARVDEPDMEKVLEEVADIVLVGLDILAQWSPGTGKTPGQYILDKMNKNRNRGNIERTY